jgi:hypothetical protein
VRSQGKLLPLIGKAGRQIQRIETHLRRNCWIRKTQIELVNSWTECGQVQKLKTPGGGWGCGSVVENLPGFHPSTTKEEEEQKGEENYYSGTK